MGQAAAKAASKVPSGRKKSKSYPKKDDQDQNGAAETTDAATKVQVNHSECQCFVDPSRYTINKNCFLGEGGYGKVFVAKDKQTGEDVAIKMLDTKRINKKAIERECHIQELVHHKFVVDLKGIFYEDSRHCANIVMEVASGGDLFDAVMADGFGGEAGLSKCFKELVEAVQYCHQVGVAHRDLKLENVLLDASKRVKVCDFGLAHLYEKTPEGEVIKVMLHDMVGSPSYHAPEVKYRYDGFEADVWSLGVCLFTMLVKFFPMEEADQADFRYRNIQRAQNGTPPMSTIDTIFRMYKRANPLSEEATDLLDGMLIIDAKNRSTMQEVLHHPWVSCKPRNAGAERKTGKDISLNDIAMMDDDDEDAPQYRSLPAEFDEPDGPPPPLGRRPAPVHHLHLHEGEASGPPS